MALSSRQFLIVSSCLILVISEFCAAQQGPRRQPPNNERPLRRLKPLKRQIASSPQTEDRFSSFGLNEGEYNDNFGKRPNFRPDGAEYDEYGNRKRYANGNLPRGYDRFDEGPQEPQQQPPQPRRPRPVYPSPKRTIDTKRKAVIDEVDPAILEELEAMPQPSQPQVQVAQPREDSYVPASGPAYASPSSLRPVYADARSDLGPGALEANILAGADAYGTAASQPDAVYQNEDRLFFQIHGQEGPHSYRYGYDTGNGYNRQFRYEERTADGYVKGRYGFYDKYGVLQVINYKADPVHGFHAEGAAVPKYPH